MASVLRAGALAWLCLSLPAAGYARPAPDKDAAKKVICQTVEEIGSRLAAKRVCLTRDQWREQKNSQRQDLEKSQRIRSGPDLTG
jgi:hypothetical protein